MAKRTEPAWWKPFLTALRNSANVRAACQAAGVSRQAVYKARQRNAAFEQQYEEAMEDATDVLDAEARRRALSGSDTILQFLLKAHRPEKYRDLVRQEHTGKDGGPMLIIRGEGKLLDGTTGG